MVEDRWWLATLTGLMAVFSYLIALKESPPRYGLDHMFEVSDDEEFLPTIAGATGVPFEVGSRIEIFNNGDEFYPAMLDAIRAAKMSINIEAYIYWDGRIGKQFAAALAERAKTGVIVKILLDAVGSASIGEDILKTLEGGGVRSPGTTQFTGTCDAVQLAANAPLPGEALVFVKWNAQPCTPRPGTRPKRLATTVMSSEASTGLGMWV